MTQEIKDKLEQAAKAEIDSSVWSNHDDSLPLNVAKNALVRFAQTILDNLGEWGLVDEKLFRSTSNSCESWANKWAEKSEKCRELQSQLTKYREALERIVKITAKNNTRVKAREIAKEALKQEEK